MTQLERELEIGSVVADSFRVDAAVARGGFATVYRGTRVADGLPVALKVMHAALHGDATMRARFRRESETLRALRHECIVEHIADIALPSRALAIVTAWVEGESLATMLERGAEVPASMALSVATDVLRGLSEMHRRGYLHRDVKPENVVVTPAARACLVDVGIAYGPFDAAAERLTPAGNRMGTLRYAAPEVLREGAVVDARSDQFSAAIVLFESLTQEPPFPYNDSLVRHEAMQKSGAAPLRAFRPDLPPEYAAVLERALAFAPNDRFPSCDAMAHALQRLGVLT